MQFSSVASILLGAAIRLDVSASFTIPHPHRHPHQHQHHRPKRQSSALLSGEGGIAGAPPSLSKEEEAALQWDLFTKHHARGRWRGTWTSYDYMGDVIDETTASVNLIPDPDPDSHAVQHTHDVVMGKASSDCPTCFDSEDVRRIPIGTYTPGHLRNYRCASIALSCGPTVLRNGAMSTELALAHGNGRLRVVFQHAPVWEQGVDPGTGPPHALKLFRTMVSREILDADAPPSYEREQSFPPARGHPRFFRPVPPFQWHKKWQGSSWTWGIQTGDRGWAIDELEEADAWHGRPTGDTSDVWAMRLPGGILLQCPRVITSGRAGLCRVAWLPEDDAPEGSESDSDDGDMDTGTAKLLRVEASVIALEPVIDEENDVMIGFYPPELGSLRCDVLQKFGELENTSMLEKLKSMGEMGDKGDGELDPIGDVLAPIKDSATRKNDADGDDGGGNGGGGDGEEEPPMDDSGIDAIRNALKL